MASKLQHFFLLLLLAVLLPPAAAHNITRILSQFRNFGTFSSLLIRTSVAAEINRRQSITVLALDEPAAAAIADLPEKALAEVLSVHVILDYYDASKLKGLKRRSALLTTLFQSSGAAENNAGFLNVTRLPNGRIAFGSGVPGAPLVATFARGVAARPYSISVLQVNNAIVPPGIDGAVSRAPAPIGALPEPLVPVPDGAADSQADSPTGEAPAPEADAPAPEVDAPAPAPAADAPAGEGPAPAAETTGDDLAPAEEEDKEVSSAGRAAGGAGLLVVAGVVLIAL